MTDGSLTATTTAPALIPPPGEGPYGLVVQRSQEAAAKVTAPCQTLISEIRKSQHSALSELRDAKTTIESWEATLVTVERTFGKLPYYVGRLQLMKQNMRTLSDNVTKTRQLALKIQADVQRMTR